MTTNRQRSGWYREVPPDDVKPQIREAGFKTLALVKQSLELEDVGLRWFKWKRGRPPETLDGDPDLAWLNRDANGERSLSSPPEPVIWIRATLKPLVAAMEIAHQGHRLWQWREWEIPQLLDPKTKQVEQRDRSRDAVDYVGKVMRYLAEEIPIGD